mgnify:CR=1 FL=1
MALILIIIILELSDGILICPVEMNDIGHRLYQEGYQSAQILAKMMAGEEVAWHTEIEEKVLTSDSDLTYFKEIWERIES